MDRGGSQGADLYLRSTAEYSTLPSNVGAQLVGSIIAAASAAAIKGFVNWRLVNGGAAQVRNEEADDLKLLRSSKEKHNKSSASVGNLHAHPPPLAGAERAANESMTDLKRQSSSVVDREKAGMRLRQALAVRRAVCVKTDEMDASLVFDAWSEAADLGCPEADEERDAVKVFVCDDLRRCVEQRDRELYRDGGKLAEAIGRAERLKLDANDSALLHARATQDTARIRGRLSLYKLASMTKRHMPLFVFSAATSAVSGSVHMVMVSRFSGLLDAAMAPVSSKKRFFSHIAHLLSFWFMHKALDMVSETCRTYFDKTVVQKLVDRLYMNILSQDITFWDQRTSKELAQFITGREGGIAYATFRRGTRFVPEYLSHIAKALTLVRLLFSKSRRLCFIMLVGMPAVLKIKKIEGKYQHNFWQQLFLRLRKARARTAEAFDNIVLVRSFGQEDFEVKRRAGERRKIESIYQKDEWQRSFFSWSTGLFTQVVSYGMVWYGGQLVANKSMSPGDFMMFFVQLMAGARPLGQLLEGFKEANELGGKLETVLALLERNPSMPLFDGLAPEGRPRGELEFVNVSFAYSSRPDVTVIEKVSFKVPAGETTAIVGITGSGKSTAIKLALRFYDPTEGSILLDGRDIREYKPNWLRSNIGLVPQEPSLFGTSVYENVMYGNRNASEEDLERSLRDAQIWDELQSATFPEKLLTEIGENQKVKVSGGQKQRLAIARALLSNPAILILDEGTSAMDANTEHEVKEALKVASANRTVLVVAHRLSTVSHANIVVLQKPDNDSPATVVECGKHQDLLAKGGAYADLVKRQGEPDTDIVKANFIAADRAG